MTPTLAHRGLGRPVRRVAHGEHRHRAGDGRQGGRYRDEARGGACFAQRVELLGEDSGADDGYL